MEYGTREGVVIGGVNEMWQGRAWRCGMAARLRDFIGGMGEIQNRRSLVNQTSVSK